jgi:hypothetical protein
VTDYPHLTACCSDRPPSMIPKANTQVGRLSGEFSWSIALATTFSPRFTIFPPRFHQPIFRFRRLPIAKDLRLKPEEAKNEPGTHHNSPQTPKTRFTHSKVVRPRLLTYSARGDPTPYKELEHSSLFAYSLSAAFPATIETDARGRVAQLDRARAF